MKVTFNYTATQYFSHEYELSECVGEDVCYQGSDGSLSEHGVVKEKDGVFLIEWEDGSPNTIFGTPEAYTILKNCVI